MRTHCQRILAPFQPAHTRPIVLAPHAHKLSRTALLSRIPDLHDASGGPRGKNVLPSFTRPLNRMQPPCIVHLKLAQVRNEPASEVLIEYVVPACHCNRIAPRPCDRACILVVVYSRPVEC